MNEKEKSLTSNEIKKGDRVILNDGTEAEVLDNRKGNIRTCRVFSLYTEIGDIYSHTFRWKISGGSRIPIVKTRTQSDLSRTLAALGLGE